MVVQPAAAGSDFVRLPWSVLEDLIDAAGGLTQSAVDGRIAAWARITPVGEVPDSSIADAITRDTELGDYALLAGATFLGLVSGLDPVDAQNFVTKAPRRRQLCHERRVYATDWQRCAGHIARR